MTASRMPSASRAKGWGLGRGRRGGRPRRAGAVRGRPPSSAHNARRPIGVSPRGVEDDHARILLPQCDDRLHLHGRWGTGTSFSHKPGLARAFTSAFIVADPPAEGSPRRQLSDPWRPGLSSLSGRRPIGAEAPMTSHLRRPSAVIGIVLCLALAAACAPSDCRRVPAPLPGRHRGHVRRGRTGVGGAAPAARVRAHPVRDARPRSAGGICLGPNSRSRSAWARSGCLGSTRVMATFDGLNHALRRARRLSGRRGEESIASKPALRSLRREADRSIGRSIASCTPNCPTTFQGVPSQTAASQIRRLAQYGTASGPTIVGPDPGRALDLEVALSWDFAVGLDRIEPVDLSIISAAL